MPVGLAGALGGGFAGRPVRPLDPDNLRIACELTELSFALHPWRFEPGVRKFRSLAEANQHRQEWEKKQVRSPL